MRLTTAGTLDPRLRAGFGLKWSDRDARALARWARIVRQTRTIAPDVITRWRAGREPR